MTTNTPWGPSQEATEIAPGITLHETTSHGGFHLSAAKAAEMPDYMRAATFGTNGPHWYGWRHIGWYEEDVDWAMVALVFPEHFQHDQAQARKILQYFNPAILQRFLSAAAVAA